jgi:hypothetical protein
MSESMSFFSKCPKCGHARLQGGYTRDALVQLLETGTPIEAYCVPCDVHWPIAVQERYLVARGIAAEQQEASPRSQHDNPTRGRPGE